MEHDVLDDDNANNVINYKLQDDIETLEEAERTMVQSFTEKLMCALRRTEEENKQLDLKIPPFPRNTYKPPPEVAEEKIGTGMNSKV